MFNLKHGKPQSVCKSCHSEYRKKHYQNNKQKYIEKSKKNKDLYKKEFYDWLSQHSCLDCGINDFRVLEFDHLGDKNFTIGHKIGVMKLSSLMEEINKCDIVCANCHKIRTASRGDWFKMRI